MFAAETRGYRERRERDGDRQASFAKKLEEESAELEEFRVVENKPENLQEVYLKEYGRRESFLWKQK